MLLQLVENDLRLMLKLYVVRIGLGSGGQVYRDLLAGAAPVQSVGRQSWSTRRGDPSALKSSWDLAREHLPNAACQATTPSFILYPNLRRAIN